MAVKTKEELVLEYVKSIATLDDCMKPYREQKTDLRKSFIANGWLTKEEIKTALKAYRLRKDETDMDSLNDMFDMMSPEEKV